MAAMIQPKGAHTDYWWICNWFIYVLMPMNMFLLLGGSLFSQDSMELFVISLDLKFLKIRYIFSSNFSFKFITYYYVRQRTSIWGSVCRSVGRLVGWLVGYAFVPRSTQRMYWPTWPCSIGCSNKNCRGFPLNTPTVERLEGQTRNLFIEVNLFYILV